MYKEVYEKYIQEKEYYWKNDVSRFVLTASDSKALTWDLIKVLVDKLIKDYYGNLFTYSLIHFNNTLTYSLIRRKNWSLL